MGYAKNSKNHRHIWTEKICLKAKLEWDGRLVAVECKSTKGRLRLEQALFLERVRGAGGVGFLVRDRMGVVRELGPFSDHISAGR